MLRCFRKMLAGKTWCCLALCGLACGARSGLLSGEEGRDTARVPIPQGGHGGAAGPHPGGRGGSAGAATTTPVGDAGQSDTTPVEPDDQGPIPESIGEKQNFEAPLPAPGPSVASNFGIDAAHSNCQVNDAVRSPISERWRTVLDGKAHYPLVADGQVFVVASGDPTTLNALDAQTGAKRWGPLAVHTITDIAYDAGRVYALGGRGELSAYDAKDGKQLYETELLYKGFFTAPPVALDGKVYATGFDRGGHTFAVDGSSGKVLWERLTPDGSDGTVAVSAGHVLYAEACSQIYRFDANRGHIDWFHRGSCSGGGGSTPSVFGAWAWVRERSVDVGNVIVDMNGQLHGAFGANRMPAFDGHQALYTQERTLTAIDIAHGSANWAFTVEAQSATSAVVAGKGRQVFVASQDDTLYEINADSGILVSREAVGGAIDCAHEGACLAIAENKLFVPAGNAVVAY